MYEFLVFQGSEIAGGLRAAEFRSALWKGRLSDETLNASERQRKKDFLDSYRELMLRARCKRLILEQLRDDYESIRGIDYETAGLPRSRGYASDLSGMYARIEERRRELDATLRQAEGLLRQIQEALEALHDPRAALIISRRHIDRRSWKEIRAELGFFSDSRVRELYVLGLDQLEIPANNKRIRGK